MDPASQDKLARQLGCSRCGIMFGLFLIAPGIGVTTMGYTKPSFRTMQVIGPILLATGFTLLAVGIVATVHLKNNLPVPQTSVTNAPVVSGMAPGWGSSPPVGVAMQPVPGIYPPQQQPGQIGNWQQPGQTGYQQQPGQVGYQQQPGQMGYQQQPVQGTQAFVPQAGYPAQPTALPMGYPSDTAGVPAVPPPPYEDMKK